ncbi:response regulator [Desulfovibrio sp. OttesenSCG-928-O18]|nr:response regulator [Desulfovibrio sp. OttesenSCG-928-O18]
MRHSAAAGWMWDTATGEVLFAAEWRDILALSSDARLGNSLEYILARLRVADQALFRAACAEIAAGRKADLDLAVRLRRFDNTWAWVLLRGKTDETGKDQGVFTGIGIEVSRLRLDKRFFPPSLDDTETTYQSLLDHSPNNIIRFDRELFPLYMNPAVISFVPGPLEELGDKKVAEIGIDTSDLDFLQTQVDRVFDTGEVVKVRRSVATSNGSVVGDFTIWPEFDAHGNVRSVISLQQDLTAEVKREKEALANELRFSALFQLTQMNDAPEEDVVRFVVEKIEELTGSGFAHLHILPGGLEPKGYIVWSKGHFTLFDEEALTARDPSLIRGEFGFDPASDPEPDTPVFRNEPVRGHPNLFFNGKLSINRFLCAPALEDGKAMCLAAVYNKGTDYTEADMRQLQTFINSAWLVLRRRRYIEELKKAKDSAEHANKVKDRFLANVSHELRTPLNGMLSMLQLLEMSPLSTDQAEYAKSAATTGQTLLRIISDILDFSKMESGKLELECDPFDFKESLVSAVNLFMGEAKKRNIALTLTTVGAFPSLVDGDEGRVRQIIFNLVGNALKFTEEGTVEVFCEARSAVPGQACFHLSVRDTGIGIPPGMQNKVFEAFTQVDGSSTRKHQGSGLGLGIVRSLTRIMGGSINLTSFPGRGTLVECVLPFTIVREALPETEASAVAPEGAAIPACPPMHVLVAEDDAVSRLAMKLFLERLGHRPVCVENGRAALEALRLFPFACLISDVLMPELDGLEVTRHIREGLTDGVTPSDAIRDLIREAIPASEPGIALRHVPRDLPIVAVSAHAMKGDREHFLEQGMDYYLSKPVKIKDLAGTLLRVHEDGEAGQF